MLLEGELIEAINPEIMIKRGKQQEMEGCLSSPGEYGITDRPQYVRMRAQDRYGNRFAIEGEDLKARCMCHERDHLDGVLFKTRAIRMLDKDELGK
jgi:peptide deformylase